MTAPAAPPTTAPMMAPRAVDPVLFPMTPPTAAPAPAPITAPRSLLLIDAQAESPNAARAATATAAVRIFRSCFIFESPVKRLLRLNHALVVLTDRKTRCSVIYRCSHPNSGNFSALPHQTFSSSRIPEIPVSPERTGARHQAGTFCR